MLGRTVHQSCLLSGLSGAEWSMTLLIIPSKKIFVSSQGRLISDVMNVNSPARKFVTREFLFQCRITGPLCRFRCAISPTVWVRQNRSWQNTPGKFRGIGSVCHKLDGTRGNLQGYQRRTWPRDVSSTQKDRCWRLPIAGLGNVARFQTRGVVFPSGRGAYVNRASLLVLCALRFLGSCMFRTVRS